MTEQGVGHGPGHGKAWQDRAEQGRQGTAVQCSAVQGSAGQDITGQSRAGVGSETVQGRGNGRAEWGGAGKGGEEQGQG